MPVRVLAASDSVSTSRFGGFCPYWTEVNGQVVVANTAVEILEVVPENRRIIDPVAVLELLQFNYMLGNRTLVQGVFRMPWRATLRANGGIERAHPIPHGKRSVGPREAAYNLRSLLEEELYSVVHGHAQVFLLLTGGLDSRVIAGVLHRIEPELQTQIICVTWGHQQSRDVTYARRIADWYDWPFIHVPYHPDLGWSNIVRGAIWGGSEVAGLHLHGAHWFADRRKDDLVIAASFGDSVGRAEFSSRHLTNCTLAPLRNTGGLLHRSLVDEALVAAEADRETAWSGEKATQPWIRCELDLQENYMRRMICHAMDYIRQFCELHQAFTSEKVVTYIWSLAPDCRTDEIYQRLLEELDPRLYSLPWARTGVAPDGTIEPDPTLRKAYHEWGKWLRCDLRARLESVLFDGKLRESGAFYWPAVRRLWRSFLREPEDSLGCGEQVVKLCSIELTRQRFGLHPCREHTNHWDTIADSLRTGRAKSQRIVARLGGRIRQAWRSQ